MDDISSHNSSEELKDLDISFFPNQLHDTK